MRSCCIAILMLLLISCKKPSLGNFYEKSQLLTKTIDSTFNCNSQINLVSELMESKYELNVLVESSEMLNASIASEIARCVENDLSPKEAFGKISVTLSQRTGDRISVGAEMTYTFNLE